MTVGMHWMSKTIKWSTYVFQNVRNLILNYKIFTYYYDKSNLNRENFEIYNGGINVRENFVNLGEKV